jgi:hypothetical protein
VKVATAAYGEQTVSVSKRGLRLAMCSCSAPEGLFCRGFFNSSPRVRPGAGE